MNSATLDLRQNIQLDIYLNNGVIYFPSLNNIHILYSYYSIIYNEGGIGEVEYNTNSGGGLTIIPQTKSILWELDTTALGVGVFQGYLKSQSKISGIYINIKINLHIV